jgi:hypothetical protein
MPKPSKRRAPEPAPLPPPLPPGQRKHGFTPLDALSARIMPTAFHWHMTASEFLVGLLDRHVPAIDADEAAGAGRAA